MLFHLTQQMVVPDAVETYLQASEVFLAVVEKRKSRSF